MDVGKIIKAKKLFDNFKKSGGVIDSTSCRINTNEGFLKLTPRITLLRT